MNTYLYLALNLGSIFVPFMASFYKKHAFVKEWKPFFLANSVVATFFIVWDVCFTHLGVWGFNKTYLMGYYLVNIPIEEVLFFFFIPYASVFIYFASKYFINESWKLSFERVLTLFMALSLAVIGLIFITKWYTASTFLLTSIFLFHQWKKKVDMSKTYVSYGATLPFFFLVNGILTGTFIKAPVVCYNDKENLGIRLGTIPIEDVFYGFLLIASIIHLYEFFKQKEI
ncbi:lycopene cyclase domain-containing protein [Flavobacterium aciduliphilum]|uniref:Lycopene cyclase domain-containing protein n=1 Tax=Flavobacterium aciduliphilum TaxID=1101402 RepID=A0A328YNJ4_9FLAO|nr:lycopene cyclase domain-containing protein [Flavobacterium aciduliphilum]RAR75658.1 lycopene cyclase domain-containing protein [Flavobacterium aciduliphilum]